MSELKYKVGDKVRIKGIDWYNENRNDHHDIVFADGWYFTEPMSIFCGKELIIERISNAINPPHYMMRDNIFAWTDEMIEGLVEEENNDCEKCGLTRNSVRCLLMDNCPHTKPKNIMEEEVDLIPKFGEYSDNEPLDIPTMTTEFVKEHGLPLPEGFIFKDENGNVINATKIVLEKKNVLEKKSSKTDDIIKWLREHDMTKYIGVIYSGMCSITFDTEKLIKDITEMIGDE